MTQIPEKIDRLPYDIAKLYSTAVLGEYYKRDVIINQLIDYLTARQELEDARYKELTSRIDTIAGNQLEMKRGEPCCENGDFGVLHKCLKEQDQPKRWRGAKNSYYFYVGSFGDIHKDFDYQCVYDNYRYNTGNYHPTREAAEAYKAKLLADNQQ
jgi:hypothetical protein